MARLIDGDALIAWIKGSQQMTSKMKNIICYIKTMPTIEAVSVVHGEWKISNLPKGEMKYCSECGFGQHIKDERAYNYCPNCGADMRKREGE